MKKSIGVFDSGFGGLTVLREIIKENPQYDYIYLGDTARVPYGTRSKDVVYDFTKQALDFLFKEGCELVILACNTASSQVLRNIQQNYLPKNYPNKNVLGVLIPIAEEVGVEGKRVGVMATEGTVSSKSFTREIRKINNDIEVFESACPLLVSIIESSEFDEKIIDLVLRKYLGGLIEKDIDTLILGCTHYDMLLNDIKKRLPENINIISGGSAVAEKLKLYLNNHPNLRDSLGKNSERKFYTTGMTDRFQNLGNKFFGEEVEVKNITL
ncbi:glutamate racemase [Patescibacteria group bacterium]